MKRNDVILMVLFVGCSPHFQSGKTQCSDKLECPSGFVCLNPVNNGNAAGWFCFDDIAGCANGSFYCAELGICKTSLAACSVTPGSGGRSGGTGGSGGTGPCPNASDYYCAASGTCWLNPVACTTVTNCGTSAAPDYRACSNASYHPDCTGKCVSTTSGGGGTGGTGAGGSTGCGAINPTCSSIATDACGICLAECCCTQLVACANNTSCTNLLSCEANCTTTACDNGCVSLYPGGETTLNSYLNCGVTNCLTACQ
jgi:hypothetical protein